MKAYIFDLDGTVGETLPLCIAAFQAAIEPLLGRKVSAEEITGTFGPSEEGTIMALIPQHFDEGLSAYVSHYTRLHPEMCPAPFAGIPQLIGQLRGAGKVVAMVTGKGPLSGVVTFRQFGLENAFDEVVYGIPEGPSKPQGIARVLEHFALAPQDAVYIGDMPGDVTIAHAQGLKAYAAAWADSADVQALKAAEPEALFTSVADCARYIAQQEGLKA